MTGDNEALIDAIAVGEVSPEVLIDEQSSELLADPDFLERLVRTLMVRRERDALTHTLEVISDNDVALPVRLLNELIVHPEHDHHQVIARELQELGDPSSVPYVRKVLVANLETIPDRHSGDAPVAKWFSWVLASIGNAESVEVLRELSTSPNPDIANEMRYRLEHFSRSHRFCAKRRRLLDR